jgi:nucleoside-diphosphate-sugar epimerase
VKAWSLNHDLDLAVESASSDLEALQSARMFITGGTGFVGTWLVAALHHADQQLNLKLDVTLLTRDPEGFRARQPELADWCTLLRGDVTEVPPLPTFDFAVHAATPASAALNDDNPDLMRSTIVKGMSSLLEALEPSGSIPLLFTSSGAIYGPQPLDHNCLPEDFEPALDAIDPRNAYAAGKREAEAMALAASLAGGPSLRLGRLFAFVGPYLPLDTHFAIGNFIRDGISGGPIKVRGDGTAVRSYMYAADMVVALLAILIRGEANRPYNVGSPEAISMRDLAQQVERGLAPGCGVEIAGLAPGQLPTGAGNRYVPDVNALQTLLGDDPCPTPLDAAIGRTGAWATDSDLC